MAEIRPFKGLRYSSNRVPNLEAVATPPYDVISPVEQQMYYARSPYNVIRLELGLEFEDDTPQNNRYTRARDFYAEWLRQGVLIPEAKPSMYVYQHQFEFQGSRRTRRALVACLRLEELDSGIVLPHEDTLDKPLGDRLSLMRACNANFSPVFGLFEDGKGRVSSVLETATSAFPAFSLNWNGGETHSFWVIDDRSALRALSESLAPAQVFIADGHHRYKTALRYRDEVRAANPKFTGEEAFNYVMVKLVEIDSPGLAILPTHRVVARDVSFDPELVEQKLIDLFEVRHFPADGNQPAEVEALLRQMETARSENVFGAFGLKRDCFTILLSRNGGRIQKAMPKENSSAWRSLDVSVLKALVLERALGVSEEDLVRQGAIEYVADEVAAARAVSEGNASLAWFLRPATVKQVRDVALASDRMPRKSTYFYPKPLTGLVLNDLNGDLPGTI